MAFPGGAQHTPHNKTLISKNIHKHSLPEQLLQTRQPNIETTRMQGHTGFVVALVIIWSRGRRLQPLVLVLIHMSPRCVFHACIDDFNVAVQKGLV